MNETIKNGNGKKTYSWLKNNYKFLFVLIGIIISATIAWAGLKAQVDNNTNNHVNFKSDIETELKEINTLLNDKDIGLPAIHQRLTALEKKN